MEIQIIKSKLQEINTLINKRQFIIAEQKSRELIRQLDTNDKKVYEYYIQAIIALSDSLSKNVKNIKAIEELEKALEVYPFEIKLLEEIYQLTIKLKRLSRAESVLKIMINIRPDDIETRIRLVKFLIDKKDYISAIYQINIIISFEIHDSSIYLMLVECLENEGLYDEAIKNIKVLQNIEPDNIYFVIYEANLFFKTNCIYKAFEIIDNLIEIKIEDKDFDYIIDILLKYSDLYNSLGYRHLLLSYFIKILDSFNDFNAQDKINIEKFSDKMKLNFVYNYLVKNQIINKNNILSGSEILENIVALKNENNRFDNYKISLEDYIKRNDIIKLLDKSLAPFIKSITLS